MPQDITTETLDIRTVVLVGRPDFGRCALATRLPTALWPVLNKTALELLLDHLAQEGVRNAVVCCGQEVSACIEPVCRRFGSDVRLLNEDLAAGTAGCLRDAVGTDPGDLILVFSSSMVAAPSIRGLIEAHRAGNAAMTMVFNPGCSNDKVPGQPAEIYLCRPEVLSYIPRAGYSDIKEGLIPAILMAGETIHPVVLAEEVGNFHDRDSYLNALFGHLIRKGNVTVADVSIHPTAKVYGPVAIAERARILDDALVVGPAVIGSESVVGRGSVIVRSVLWDHVSIGDGCELRESVVDHQVAIPDGSVFVEHAVTANTADQCRKSKVVGPLRGGLDRLDALWQGRMKWPVCVLGAVIVLVALLWSYWPTVADLWEVWVRSDEYSAGLLVPFIALYVFWLRRHDIGREGIRPAVLPGIAAFVLAQVGRSVGLLFMYGFGERLSMVLSMGAIILLLCGWTVLRKLASILLFLCLMVPWPNSIQSQIGLPLQSWATTSAVFCLELAGYSVLRDGNVIHIGNASVAVAEACNGLRMVTAFFVISGLVVLLAQRAWWEKVLVLASSVPIAMFCNTLRLAATAVAFTLFKGEYWTKMFHDFGGYAMMPLALALVVGEFWVLTRLTTPPDQTRPVVIIRAGRRMGESWYRENGAMNNLEKYLDQVIEQKPVVYETPSQSPQMPKSNIVQAVLRRWYIALFVALALCGVGMPVVWLLIKPKYVVVGAMNVSPVVTDILTGKSDYREATNYREFVNTQVVRLLSGPTLQKIADDLKDSNLAFFSAAPQTRMDKVKDMLGIRRGTPEIVAILKDAIDRGVITAGAIPLTTLVAVTMKSENDNEARQIVDSFLRNYEEMYGKTSRQEEKTTLDSLETNKKNLLITINDLHEQIKNLTIANATTDLKALQEMELGVQTKLLAEHTDLEVKRIGLETSIALLERTEMAAISPEQAVAASREYVNSDPSVKELSTNIVAMERDLLIARKNLSVENPDLKRREGLVADFKKTLEDRRKELEKEFNEGLNRRREEAAQQKLKDAKAELAGLEVHLTRIKERLGAQEQKTQKLGRDSFDIQDKQFNLNMNSKLYEDVLLRLKTLQMEQQQQPRILRDHPAEIDKIEDKRVKYSAALVFAALGCGCGLALLRDKADKTLQNPEDVSRHLGLPLLGTTTSSRTVRPELFAEQIAGDYQTIRTNLGLATSGGMPRRIAVSSAGTKEGKTTFAVNLATSLAKAGKKVLLIDGDLRKPDIRYMLNLPNGTAGVQEVLLGEDPSQIVRTIPGTGLHVLVANSRSLADVYELLTSPTAAEQIDRLCREYDHVIVDTPPALAFPDALVWAKLTDAVVLVGFAGQTTSTDLKEAKDRFQRVRARVLGAILSNVRAEQSLYRYSYGYVSRSTTAMRKARKRRKLLLPVRSSQDAKDT